MADNNKLMENALYLISPEVIQKYLLGTKKNGTPRAVYDVVKDYTKPKKKKDKKKNKDVSPALSLYLGTKKSKKKNKKKKKNKHWHI